MKKVALMIAIFVLSALLLPAKAEDSHHVKKDTVRDIKNQPKPHVIENRQQRMRLQMKQLKDHEKELKKIHDAEKELKKEQPQSN